MSQPTSPETDVRGDAPTVACPACLGVAIGSAIAGDLGWPVYECHRCGLRWLRSPPVGDELSALYDTGYYVPAPPRGGPLVGGLHRLNNAVRVQELDDMQPGRLLDVGCGKGRFLAAARDAGWEVQGVEFAPSSAAAAAALYGLDVVVGDFVAADLDGPFDAITLWHVLEHLPDPNVALARAAALLRPGGRLVVSVPNNRSLQASLGGDAWFHLDLPRHIFHFTPVALTTMVERAGFDSDRIGTFYPEMEAVGLIQTALARAGLGDGLLYRFAKRDPTAPFGPRVAASLALAVALVPAAVSWSMIAPLLGTGASMQLVAHRT